LELVGKVETKDGKGTSNQSQEDKFKDQVCHNCGQIGHVKKFCPNAKKNNNTSNNNNQKASVTNNPGKTERMICSYCGKPNHDESTCFKRQNDEAVEKNMQLTEKVSSLKKAMKKNKKVSIFEDEEEADRVEIEEICFMNKVKIIGENAGVKFKSTGSLIHDFRSHLEDIQCEQDVGLDSCCTRTMTPFEEDLKDKKESDVKVKFANQERTNSTVSGTLGDIPDSILVEQLEGA
jgi:hypothetical protein